MQLVKGQEEVGLGFGRNQLYCLDQQISNVVRETFTRKYNKSVVSF